MCPPKPSIFARLGEAHREAPFALWGDHLMIARGRVGNVPNANIFVDSGLVAGNTAQGQAAILTPRRALASWGVTQPEQGRFAELPGPVAIGTASRSDITAYVAPDRTWRGFSDWGGIRVDALVSWGFLQHFAWTIDCDVMRPLLHAAPTPETDPWAALQPRPASGG